MLWLLAGGIVLRLLVCALADPTNPDQHLEVIQYAVEHHHFAVSNELGQSYHPPLYYLIAAPIYAWKPDLNLLHFVSFFFSCANLMVIWWLLRDPLVIRDDPTRVIAFALACVMPEFVMFASFISNDCVALLIGSLIFAAIVAYIRKPDKWRLSLLGVMVGLGLLTKGTFIATGFVLLPLIFLVERNARQNILLAIALYCALWLAIGCYKYVENYIYLHRVIVHNLERPNPLYDAQKGMWHGWATVFDINLLELLRRPVLKVYAPHSYPLMMYATLWYPYIPESSFEGNVYGYMWLGAVLYVTALIPTLIFLIGIGSGTAFGKDIFDPRRLVLTGSALLLLSNLFIVIAAGLKFDIWWCFQSRLCFQSMMPGLVLFGRGMELLPDKKWLRQTVYALCWITIGLCLLYFLIEFGLVLNILPVGEKLEV